MEGYPSEVIGSGLCAEALGLLGACVVITDHVGTIVFVNKAFEETTGFAANEATGQKMSILKSGHQSKGFYVNLWESIQTTGQWEGTLWNRRKNGDIYHERLSIRRLEDRSEQEYYVGVFTDISEQDELQKALVDAQKRELMVTMVGGVAHNFNNYMAAVHGLAYLGGKSASDEKTKRYLSEISKVTDRNAHLVKDLINISRPSRSSDVVCSLTKLMRQSVETLKVVLPENIEMALDLPDEDDCWIKAHPTDVEQVIYNLINNAGYALKNTKHPKIEIGVFPSNNDPEQCKQRCSRINYCPVNTEKNVIIRIEDNGMGMPLDIQNKIFTPFFTTKSPDNGTGLGLASVNQVINQLGGAIWVTSRENEGTRFTMCLPRVDEPPNEASIRQ